MNNIEFIEYELNNKKIVFSSESIIHVQVGKAKRSYKTKFSFKAKEFGLAVMNYNMINIGNGYKKRLICFSLNKPLLDRKRS